MKRNVWCGLALVTALVAACGGDDGGLKKDDEAPEKCTDFIEAACANFVACGHIDESQLEDCYVEAEAAAGGDCDDATHVAKDYDRCLDELEDECSEEPELPSICKEVIGVAD